jgi:hypothetical protein
MKPAKGKLPPKFAKGKKAPVSKAQARHVAQMMGKKAPKAPVMDAEDKIDGGVDENTEKD